MFDTLMSWETGTFDMPASRQDAARLAGNGEVEATLSWIEATDRLLRPHGVPLLVFLAPVGSVDPDYADFWSPWPRAYSWNHLCDDGRRAWRKRCRRTGIRTVNLHENLAGIPGTYRKLDGHWSQKGEAIVADRAASELRKLLPKPGPAEHVGGGIGTSRHPDRSRAKPSLDEKRPIVERRSLRSALRASVETTGSARLSLPPRKSPAARPCAFLRPSTAKETVMSNIESVVERYVASWNETDPGSASRRWPSPAPPMRAIAIR